MLCEVEVQMPRFPSKCPVLATSECLFRSLCPLSSEEKVLIMELADWPSSGALVPFVFPVVGSLYFCVNLLISTRKPAMVFIMPLWNLDPYERIDILAL